jgi:glycosyltransferase involved in cell wall biosynthesis
MYRRFSECIDSIRQGEVEAAKRALDIVSREDLPRSAFRLFQELCLLADHSPVDARSKSQLVAGELVPDWFSEEQGGVSLVTCAMNRTENLIKALPTWLACDEISEIVIVDWSSSARVSDALSAAGFDDERIMIIEVVGEPRWILSYAFNLGFRFASGSYVLKTDADIQVKPDFFHKNVLRAGQFIAGDWRSAPSGQEHINGFFFISRADLRRVKGFNEFIVTYGWDDDDIYARFIGDGLERRGVNTESIWHIPHSDSLRISDSDVPIKNAWNDFRSRPAHKIRSNRWLAFVAPPWTGDRNFTDFEIVEVHDRLVSVRRLAQGAREALHEDIRSDADYYAALEMLSWRLGASVFTYSREVVTRVLKTRSMQTLSFLDFEIEAQNVALCKDYKPRLIFLLDYKSEQLDTARRWIEIVKEALGYDDDVAVVMSGGIEQNLTSINLTGYVQLVLHEQTSIWRQETVPESLQSARDLLANGRYLIVTLSSDGPPSWLSSHKLSLGERPEEERNREWFKSLNPKPRRLYVDVQHGLGNRLRALGSAAAIAQQTKRELVVIWTPDHHCDCHIHDVLDYKGKVFKSAAECGVEDADYYTYMELEDGAFKGKQVRLDTDRDVFIRTAYVINSEYSSWESENIALRSIQPSEAVNKLVQGVQSSGALGVHIRMEGAKGSEGNSYDSDVNWTPESHNEIRKWRGESHYNRFMKRIDAMILADPGLKIFLAADLAEVYSVFSEYYTDRVSFLPRTVFDRSVTQIQHALADAILLSKCSYLLGSTWSSFSELAQRLSISLQGVELSGVDF